MDSKTFSADFISVEFVEKSAGRQLIFILHGRGLLLYVDLLRRWTATGLVYYSAGLCDSIILFIGGQTGSLVTLDFLSRSTALQKRVYVQEQTEVINTLRTASTLQNAQYSLATASGAFRQQCHSQQVSNASKRGQPTIIW